MVTNYELMLLLKKDVSVDGIKKTQAILEKLMGAKGKVTTSVNLGKKHLAYPIMKETDATYFLYKLALEGSEVAAISNKLNFEEEILRFLFVKIEERKVKAVKAKTSAVKH